MNTTSKNTDSFSHPRYWGIWVGIFCFKIIARMSLSARWRVGRWLGFIGYHLARNRRHIVETNIGLCFPELTSAEQRRLVRDNFTSSGISLTETACVWFSNPKQLAEYQACVDIIGLENIHDPLASGKGVLLLGMHMSTLDFCGAMLDQIQPFDVMYRRNKNRLLEHIMTKGREQHFDSAIERKEVRQVIRRLKQGAVVWYGPDQDYGRKHSVFAPFFGQDAATITATARIAKMTGAAVIIYSHYRDLDTGRYTIKLSPPLQQFPDDDEVANGARINGLIEQAIREAPEQYWWLHRRFKTRPEGVVRPY